jgi:hypothetical protein
VYSFDGQGFALEGDALGGALFRASRRTDRLALDHLVPVNGEYRVRLANPQPEIQYVDDIALLVVDHEPGARIVLAGDGVRAVSAPVAPASALDADGRDVRAQVAEADGESWTSLPPGLGREAGRDTLRLEFPRPRNASAATLAFRVRSTQWASHVLRSLLGLHGRALPAWFARMETADAERRAFEAAMRREGAVQVRVWDGQAWQAAGLLPLSRAAAREQAVAVPLAGGADTLRVELSSTAGLWMVDRALADYGAEQPLEVREIQAERARASDGSDLRDVLGRADGRAYVMEEGHSADVAFRVPPPRPGRERSLAARLGGHYTVLVPSLAPPQEARFQALVATPGAVAEYARGVLAAETEGRTLADANGAGGRDRP